MTTTTRHRLLGKRTWQLAALWLARLLPLGAMLAIGPGVLDFLAGNAGAAAQLKADAPEVLGESALLTLAATFAVRPIATVTGWRWHLILGRDLGLWTFVLAALDLLITAMTAPSGWLDGVAGTLFLAAGTAATLLMVPLVLTSNRASMRLLGRRWKVLHKLTYVVVALVCAHLVLLNAERGIGAALLLFGPSVVLRIPPVRRRVVRARKHHRARRRDSDRHRR